MASPILKFPFLSHTTSLSKPLAFYPLSLTPKPRKTLRPIHVKQQQGSIKCHAVTDLTSSNTVPSSIEDQSKGEDNDDHLVLVGPSSEEERSGERSGRWTCRVGFCSLTDAIRQWRPRYWSSNQISTSATVVDGPA